ncbi:hypothetical protein D1F64_07510 [Breoghania sp. L-A4]|nr:hypothetical protein D1F64_07510 [Breoghania sp. L-A4]
MLRGRENACCGEAGDDGVQSVMCAGSRVSVPADVIRILVSEGIVERWDNAEAARKGMIEGRATLAVTGPGRAWLRRALSEGEDPFRAQHQERARCALDGETQGAPAAHRPVTINLAESPLSWLARRKRPDGRPWLSSAQVAAGERLRADFTRGGMMARVTTDWSAIGQGGRRRSGGAGGGADLTEAVLAARARVRAALDRTGPGLSAVLVDVCCHLKGLESVERQRGWPARSAKVILSIALEGLAAHYGFSDEATGPARHRRQAAASAASASARTR